MTTMLFFDDNSLGVRENVIRGVGRPELIPESVWHDDDRLNTHWGYPGVFSILGRWFLNPHPNHARAANKL